MLNVARSPLLRYGGAVLIVGLALLLQIILIPWFGVEPDASPFMMFFAAVIVAAYVGGLGPGLLATALSALASNLFFLSPQYTFWLDSFGQGLRLMIFVLEGALISLLVEAMRSARWRADASTRQAREVRESLRWSEERFRLLVEGARDYAILTLDPEGRIVSWNTGAERLLGYREAEIGGQHVSLLFTPEDVQRGEPERELRKAVDEGRAEDERWHVRKDGTFFWSTGIVTHLLDEDGNPRGFSKVMRDFTERKKAEEVRVQLAAIVESSEDAIIGKTLEGVITSWNRGAQKLYGYSAQEAVGRSIKILAPPELSDEISEILAKLKRGEAIEHYETVRVSKDGRRLDVSLAISPITDSAGNVTGASTIARDITERKRTEEELAERRRQLKELVGKLLTAQEEERRKIAFEIHDGLTQMAIGLHQRLQAFADDHPPGSEVGEGELDRPLALAQETVRESRRVIEGLRPSALDDFGLTIALRMWVEELEKSEGLQVGYEDDLGEERLPAEAETTLYRVAQEALTNISKHARTKKAYLTLERLEPGKVCLQVSDEGRGFDPLAKAQVGRGGGPGERMGLTSMQERVSLLGGELRIRSRPGSGTSVIAEVPLQASSEEEGGNEHNAG